jgi:N-acetylneuraminic acid mutarotase
VKRALAAVGGLAAALQPAVALAQWRGAAPLDAAVHGAAAVESGGIIYVAGGDGLLAPNDDFSAYDPSADVWTALEPLPARLADHAMAALDGRIYVAGGSGDRIVVEAESGSLRIDPFAPIRDDGGPTEALWIYDIAEERWRAGPAMPKARCDFSLTALDGLLYATGADRLVAFDPAAGEWIDLGLEPLPGRSAAGAALDGKLYLVGGAPRPAACERNRNVGGEAAAAEAAAASARVDVYDVETRLWSRGPDLPSPRHGHTIIAVEGELHVLGGRGPGGAPLDDHYVLRDGVWTAADKLPSPRADAAAAPLPEDGFAVIGGAAGDGFFAPFTALDAVDLFRD